MAQNPTSLPQGDPSQQLRLIVDNVPGFVFTMTRDGRMDFVSRPLRDYLGTSLADGRGSPMPIAAVHADDVATMAAEWARAVAAGASCEFDLRLRGTEGAYRWFRFRAAPGPDVQRAAPQWYGLLTDIDESKRAQEASRLSERELRELIDRIPGLVYTMTPACALEQVNHKVLEYFGRTFEELKRWDDSGCVHPQDMPRVLDSLRRTVEFGEPHEVEQRLRRADGSYRWFKPRALPLRDARGRILRWYCLLTDIDDLKNAEEGMRNAQARLSRAAQLATVSELAAAIAHEVNQPLAAVVAHADACRRWLSAEVANVERAARSADLIVRDGNAAAEVLRRIRSLFRHAVLDKAPLDLNEVIAEVCNLMADDVRARGITLELCLHAERPRTVADRIQLQQVLTNLVRNAIEAMESVAGRPKVLRISSRQEGPEVIVEIADQGIGIGDPENLFESFYTTKPQGMGMGLAICRSIIETHGGRIWAASDRSDGATFGFALNAFSQESP